jgi:hypothetical protein
MKELKESDLQVGDILIFENQDFDFALFLKYYNKSKESAAMYLLLYMIPWFDPGDNPENYKNIYHAAIWGNVNVNRGENKLVENLNRIVQAGTHGIDQAELDSTLKGAGVKNIYVYRFDKIDDDFENNINTQIRAFYNDTSIPYSYETAWLLAVICSMRYSDGELHKILKEKLGASLASFMTSFIKDMVNKYSKDHQKHMVACSTLVAMIYKNANYPLKINDLVNHKLSHTPITIDKDVELPLITIQEDHKLPEFKINEIIVTPRQLFESKSVKAVGYFPFKG